MKFWSIFLTLAICGLTNISLQAFDHCHHTAVPEEVATDDCHNETSDNEPHDGHEDHADCGMCGMACCHISMQKASNSYLISVMPYDLVAPVWWDPIQQTHGHITENFRPPIIG